MTQTAEPQTTTTDTPPKHDPLKTWAVVELMGHVRTGGLVTEEQRFGATLGRIEIPQADGSFVTQYFGGSSVYRLTVCDEAIAREAAKGNTSAPLSEWSLRRLLTPPAETVERTGRCTNCGLPLTDGVCTNSCDADNGDEDVDLDTGPF